MIAVFDAQLGKPTEQFLLTSQCYATVKNVNNFYEDIIDMSKEHGIRLCVKSIAQHKILHLHSSLTIL